MPRIKVVDLSHYNSIPKDLKAAYSQGVRGVIHKCTEGTGWKDSKAAARYFLAQDAGMLWGLYHFIRQASIDAQVDWFLKNAETMMDENTLLACDWEDSGVMASEVAEFMAKVRSRSGREPVLYTRTNIVTDQGPANGLDQYRLWLADYNDPYDLPAGWHAYYLLQYSDGENGATPNQVQGVNPPVDCNNYLGSDAELARTWVNGDQEPDVNPIPVNISIDAPQGVQVNVTVNGVAYV